MCFLESTGKSDLSYVKSVLTGMVSGDHKESQGSEDYQFQHFLEERPRVLCHLTPLPPRKDVRNSCPITLTG